MENLNKYLSNRCCDRIQFESFKFNLEFLFIVILKIHTYSIYTYVCMYNRTHFHFPLSSSLYIISVRVLLQIKCARFSASIAFLHFTPYASYDVRMMTNSI